MLTAAARSREGLDFYQRLVDGDEQACHDLVLRLRGEGASILRLCEALTEAFYEIGNAWESSRIHVYTEHVASQIGYRVLMKMRSLCSEQPDGPVALGCTPERDPYTLPTLMVEIVLRELGWYARSIGPNLPLEMLVPALDQIRPRLCWVSVSHVESVARMRDQLSLLGETGRQRDISVICGGRALNDELKDPDWGVTFLEDLRELSRFAELEL